MPTYSKIQNVELPNFTPAGKTPQPIETITVSQGETSTGNLGNAVSSGLGTDIPSTAKSINTAILESTGEVVILPTGHEGVGSSSPKPAWLQEEPSFDLPVPYLQSRFDRTLS
jgi:hypothetical protein